MKTITAESTPTTAIDWAMRALSHKGSLFIAKHWGGVLGTRIVVGFPRSGTSFLSDVLGKYYDLPVPRWYFLPIAHGAIIHTHTEQTDFEIPIYYIVRDGREAYVSYFLQKERGTAANLNSAEIRDAFVRFLREQIEAPVGSRLGWGEHVYHWRNVRYRKAPIYYVRYEDLVLDLDTNMRRLILEGDGSVDENRLKYCLGLSSFDTMIRSRRPQTTFSRGTRRSWRDYFDQISGALFAKHYGQALISEGYEESDAWVDKLGGQT